MLLNCSDSLRWNQVWLSDLSSLLFLDPCFISLRLFSYCSVQLQIRSFLSEFLRVLHSYSRLFLSLARLTGLYFQSKWHFGLFTDIRLLTILLRCFYTFLTTIFAILFLYLRNSFDLTDSSSRIWTAMSIFTLLASICLILGILPVIVVVLLSTFFPFNLLLHLVCQKLDFLVFPVARLTPRWLYFHFSSSIFGLITLLTYVLGFLTKTFFFDRPF